MTTTFDLNKINGDEPPIETEQDTLQAILCVLKKIDNKMDSIETAATRNNKEYDQEIQDAFDLGCEHEAKSTNKTDDLACTPSGIIYPKTKEPDDPYHKPLTLGLCSIFGGPSSAYTRFECFCSKLLTFKGSLPDSCRSITCECGKTWQWYPEDEAPALDDGRGKYKRNSFVQWKRDYLDWKLGQDEDDQDEDALNLLHRAERKIRALINIEKQARKVNKRLVEELEQQGLREPSTFDPADGQPFIIQHTAYGYVCVEKAHYRADEEEFCTVASFLKKEEIQAMMPFPRPVEIEADE